MAHDHSDQANDAIAETIRDPRFRPSATGSWMIFKADKSPLNFASDAEWMGFLGAIIESYLGKIAPCQCLEADTFAGLKSKQLIQLRDAMLEATQCAL